MSDAAPGPSGLGEASEVLREHPVAVKDLASRKRRRPSLRAPNALALVLLLVGLVCTGLGVWLARQSGHSANAARFDQLAERVTSEIEQRFKRYVHELEGVRGLYAASETVERGEFPAYFASSHIPAAYLGAASIGFVERVPRNKLKAFVAAQRAAGATNYTVHDFEASLPIAAEGSGQAAVESDLYLIKYMKPAEPNPGALGLNIAREPLRRAAAERAMLTGEAALSERASLDTDEHQRQGYMCFLPVFRNGTSPQSPEERRAALAGWVYVTLVIDETFAGVTGVAGGMIDLAIYDGGVSARDKLIFRANDSGGASMPSAHQPPGELGLERENVLILGGRAWTLSLRAAEAFKAQRHQSIAVIAGIGGTLLSVLLSLLIWSLGRSQVRAMVIAGEMTRELRMAEAATRRARVQAERLSQVARRTGNAVIVTDAAGLIEWVNEGFTRITGYALGEAMGRKPGELLRGARTDRAESARMGAAIRAGESITTELVNYTKDGREYNVRIEVEPLHDDAGTLTGFMAIETDVTEARRTAETLRVERVRLESLVHNLPGVAFRMACDTDRTVLFVSSAIERITGYPATDFINNAARDCASITHPDDRCTVTELVERAIAAREPFSIEYRMIHRSGQVRWVNERASVMCEGTAPKYLEGVLFDITELREARMAAESASRAKSEFLANMSHEIRTPLTAILGYADLLREDGNLDLAPKSRVEIIDTIRGAGQHLLAVINNILDLSKIEAGKMVIHAGETYLIGILAETESLLRPQATEKGLALEIRLETPIPERIISESTHVRQILLNLVSNAIKFTEAGSVTVRVSAVPAAEGSVLRIDVEDTGLGISPDQTTKLFYPFMQADSGMARKFGGAGLGLTISRQLAQLMGGKVTLERTSLGKGSTFRLELPLKPLAGAACTTTIDHHARNPSTTKPPLSTTLRGRILLAEDGPDNQRLISFHLRRAGAEVDVAENGRIALEMLDKAAAGGRPYDLLVSDMQMPEMDGYVLARTLRERGGKIPVIALTAHAMAEDRDRCIAAGCNAYESKPIDRARLVAKCAEWMKNGERTSGRA